MKDKILTIFTDSREVTESGLDTIEHLFLTLATRAAPWLAPAGPAILIYRALQHRLGVNPVAAAAMGLAVELVGIATSHLTVNCWQWNQTKRKSDPAAPTAWAAAMTAAYLIGAVAVSTILEVWPDFAPYAPVVFFALAACAYGSLALGSQLKRWQTERTGELAARRDASDLRAKVEKLTAEAAKLAGELDKARRENAALRAQKTTAKQAANPGNSGPTVADMNAAKAEKIAARRAEIARMLTGEPGLSNAELARRFDVSADTIRRDLKALEPDGLEVVDVLRAVASPYMNGNGKAAHHAS